MFKGRGNEWKSTIGTAAGTYLLSSVWGWEVVLGCWLIVGGWAYGRLSSWANEEDLDE